MKVFVQYLSGNILSLDVENTDSIELIKQQIENKKGTPLNEQFMNYKGIFIKDERTQEYCNIMNETSFNFVNYDESIKIYIKSLDGMNFPLYVKATDTIGSVKEQIKDRIGIPSRDQILRIKGTCLWDEKTVQFYEIKNEDTLRFTHLYDGCTNPLY